MASAFTIIFYDQAKTYFRFQHKEMDNEFEVKLFCGDWAETYCLL